MLKMTWVSIQKIFLGSLLLFNEQTSSAARCISQKEMQNRMEKFQTSYWDKLSVSKSMPRQDARTCAQAAIEMQGGLNNRAVSPWDYSLNRDEDRFPAEITFANCLCEGCIINHHEDLSYNSVPVSALVVVLRKSRCHDYPDKYVVKKHFIKVPVACTCAVPKYIT
ncbi:uncharacterized protein V6R79_013214 [Siganus canaliculatus]